MFSKILIANRGEIACRIIRTAHRMGVRTVAVFSDVDREALHVKLADEAVWIGSAAASDSYLRGDRIIEAAKSCGAEAIHPGYGFLSENPQFVEAVEQAGLVFIGPPASAIRAMGLKDAAKQLMEKAKVAVVPGYHGDAQELVVLASKANEIGFPVLIKARAGGGGKGMRRVDQQSEFAEALSSARREAKAAFGDDRVLVEKYIQTPRHIEIQVFADSHGNVVHLFERDCSLQRRHQKVIEEAPAPGMSDEMRAAMGEAAVKAAAAIGYVGAGTIEFIVDASDGLSPSRFWFMEMNTRLQVEHPVTECISGQDLVEWQLVVAAGGKLPLAQSELQINGHAFEARLYAEDATRNFAPATGVLAHLNFPADGGVRIDTGVQSGDQISPFYDPMIAKVIVHADDRAEALRNLLSALAATDIGGTTTNVAFLSALAADPDFSSGLVDTGLIERKLDQLASVPEPDDWLLAFAAVELSGMRLHESKGIAGAIGPFNLWGAPCRRVQIGDPSGVDFIVHRHGTTTWRVEDTNGASTLLEVHEDQSDPLGVRVGIGERIVRLKAVRHNNELNVFFAGQAYSFATPHETFASSDGLSDDGLSAPMPGVVKALLVQSGMSVKEGDPLVVMEAMKMEITLKAPRDGKILDVLATENLQVEEGHILVSLCPEED